MDKDTERDNIHVLFDEIESNEEYNIDNLETELV